MKIKLGQKVIGVYGPMISEKMGLAVNLAKYIWGKYNLDVELISADSKKTYKDFCVGQALLFPRYQDKMSVQMIGFIDSLDEPFSLYDYQKMAIKIIDKAHRDNKLPIIFGGGAVWISSVLENWRLPKEWQRGQEYKKSYGKGPVKYDSTILIPEVSKKTLYKKIELYTHDIVEKGILDELKKLAKKYNIDPLAPKTENALFYSFGYRRFLEYCYGKRKPLEDLTKEDVEAIRRRLVRDYKAFVRHQLSWIPKMEGEKNYIRSWQEARKIVDEFLLR